MAQLLLKTDQKVKPDLEKKENVIWSRSKFWWSTTRAKSAKT
jgi:hypothetical protein